MTSFRPAARAARCAGHGGAHGLGRVREHDHEEQHGAGDRVPGVLQGVQAAAGATLGRVRDVGMNEDAFARHRSLLFTVAYEMLGSAADAEDVVQETWLRWADVDHAVVRDPRAYLVRIVTRQALNRLRSLARRREDYVGEWLPEPLLTAPTSPPTSSSPRACRSRCSPCSRPSVPPSAPFRASRGVRHALRRDRGGGRQVTRRRPPDRPPARDHVAARRPRMPVSTTEQQEAVDRFLAAIRHGDLQGLLDVLAPDVVVVADGGGLVTAADVRSRAPNGWPASCSRSPAPPTSRRRPSGSTGHPPSGSTSAARLDTAVSLAVENGRITRIYAIRNPHKLARLDGVAALTRTSFSTRLGTRRRRFTVHPSPGAAGGGLVAPYDLVLAGGRVIDPETGSDSVCDVGDRRSFGSRRSGTASRAPRPSMSAGSSSPPWLRRPPQPRPDAAGTATPARATGSPPCSTSKPAVRPVDRAYAREAQRGSPIHYRVLGVVGGGSHARGRGRAARRWRGRDLRRDGRVRSGSRPQATRS